MIQETLLYIEDINGLLAIVLKPQSQVLVLSCETPVKLCRATQCPALQELHTDKSLFFATQYRLC